MRTKLFSKIPRIPIIIGIIVTTIVTSTVDILLAEVKSTLKKDLKDKVENIETTSVDEIINRMNLEDSVKVLEEKIQRMEKTVTIQTRVIKDLKTKVDHLLQRFP